MEIKARLDKNESPVDVPEIVKHRIMELGLMTEFNRYDSPHRSSLEKALAQANSVSADSIVLTNGADEAICIVAMAFGGPKVTVIIPSPTFVSYPAAARWSHSPIADIPRLLPDFRMDTDRIAEAALKAQRENPDARFSSIVFVCRPNNPTADMCSEEEVKRLLQIPGCLVVVDEAYYEFSGSTLAPWIDEHQNLVIIRTFSKAYSIAGLRVGYTIASPETAKSLDQNRLVFNVNVFSQAAALVALNDRAYFVRWAQEMRAAGERLQSQLALIPGISVLPSATNFVLFSTPLPAETVKTALSESGVLVTTYPGEPLLQKHVRVSVGSAEENAMFVRELTNLMKAPE